MNARTVSTGILVVASLGMVLVLIMQHRHLASLRARKLQFTTETSPSDRPALLTANANSVLSPPPLELLELRSKVTRLTQLKNELEHVRQENEQLRVRLALRGSNDSVALPPGYFRPSQAQWLGTDKPENTFQSFYWAIEHRDLTNLLALCTQHFRSEVKLPENDTPEEFQRVFKDLSPILGIHVLREQIVDPNTIRLDVEYLLRLPNSLSRDTDEATITFRRINGQWKQD